MRRFRSAALLLFILSAALAQAAGKPPQAQLPPGMGRYILVLKLPDERRDTPKTITEPDVAKLGGKVLSKHDNRRVIELPSAAAKTLRDNASVAYLQRVWMGESFDTWDERDLSAGSSSLKAHTDDTAGTNLTWDSGTFTYDPSGNVKGIGSDAYTYDTASRIVKAVVGGQSESYAYDSFGNLTQKTLTGQPPTIPAIDSTSNRVLGEAYDAAGNMTTSGSRTGYVYDSAGSLVQFNTSLGQSRRMIYTADDERIGEMLDSQLVRWKVRDFSTGQILREFQSEASPFSDVWEWTEDYVYAGSTVVGAETETYWGGKRHFHLDHLGSVRMITNDARMRYSRNDYYPFGTEQSSSVQEATNFGYWRSDPVKFTGHEREYYGILNVDNSDYLDNMHARFYNPNLGRFLSVDRGPFDPSDPQKWNRYVYANNNPLAFLDLTGFEGVYVFNTFPKGTNASVKDPNFEPNIAKELANAGVNYYRDGEFTVDQLNELAMDPTNDIILVGHSVEDSTKSYAIDFMIGRNGADLISTGIANNVNSRSFSILGCISSSNCSLPSNVQNTPGVYFTQPEDANPMLRFAATLALGLKKSQDIKKAATTAKNKTNASPWLKGTKKIGKIKIREKKKRQKGDGFMGTGFVTADGTVH